MHFLEVIKENLNRNKIEVKNYFSVFPLFYLDEIFSMILLLFFFCFTFPSGYLQSIIRKITIKFKHKFLSFFFAYS